MALLGNGQSLFIECMTRKILTPDWLTRTNQKLINEGVPADRRFRKARALWWAELLPDRWAYGESGAEYERLQIEQERSFAEIESFFVTQGQKRRARGMIGGPIYRGAFYYFGNFWPFFVPLVMGQRGVRFLECLDAPPEFLSMLRRDEFGLNEFSRFGEDCIDYGYAIDEVISKGLSPTANRFFVSADAHLTATSQMLFMEPHDTKPLLDAAMSIEIFCKAFMAVKENKTENELREKYRHNVKKLIRACLDAGLSDLSEVITIVDNLPGVEGRYTTTESVLGELWLAYRAALLVGVTILRELAGRDCRKQIAAPN